MSILDWTWLDYLNQFFDSQDTVFQKKVKEKLRAFLNLSTGKASILVDIVGEADVEAIQFNRQKIWEWHRCGSVGSSPFLPPSFPVQFFIAKFGPFSVGVDDSVPDYDHFVPLSVQGDVMAHSVKRVSPGEYLIVVSFDSYEAYTLLSSELRLKPSERYCHSFYGTQPTEKFGKIPVALHITSLADIVSSTSSGLNGKPLTEGTESGEFVPVDEKEAVTQRIAWFESELALIEASIIGPAFGASSIANLWLRRDTLYSNMDPKRLTWRGERECVVPIREAKRLNFRTFNKLSIVLGGIPKHFPGFDFIQDWFNGRVERFHSDPGSDPGDANDGGIGRLHFLLSETIRHHESMANGRDNPDENRTVREWKVSTRCGGLERDLATPLTKLSVYDPVKNPEGIFLCPTYLPSHMLRLCEWFTNHVPELKEMPDGSDRVHFIHIDSEGEFFQLHTETGGAVMIFTGMNQRTEQQLADKVRFTYRLDVSSIWRNLEEMTKEICREFTLSRPDVVFGGDRAACPLASHSEKRKNDEVVPWMDSDMTGWFWFIQGRPGVDFFCSRSIDRDAEKRIVETCPMGFKSVVDCGPAWLQGPRDSCICRKFYGDQWLRTCEPAHPQIWHGYPQSGAVSSKNLSRDKLDWTILYYSIADLIKAKMLTQHQDVIDVDIITPFFEV